METGTLRIIVFSAHTEDAPDLAGGTLAKYANKGHEVMAVIFSLGAKSHVMTDASPEELRTIKRVETERAYAKLGIQHVRSLEMEEDPILFEREHLADIVELIRAFRPDIVLTHHRSGDVVPDHNDVGRAVWHACHMSGRPGFKTASPPHGVPSLFYFELGLTDRAQRMTGSPAALPDVYIDITDTVQQKIKSMAEFATQQYTIEFLRRRMETLDGHCGVECGVGYAEPFYSHKPLVFDELPFSKGVANHGRQVRSLASSG